MIIQNKSIRAAVLFPLLTAIPMLVGCDSKASADPAKPGRKPDVKPDTPAVEKPYKDAKELMKPPADARPLAWTPTRSAKDLEGLKIRDLKEGMGPELKYGEVGRFHLVYTLSNGRTALDTRQPSGMATEAEPRGFAAIDQDKLKGLGLGVVGMKKGGVRTLIIPAEYAFGQNGDPMQAIPENATLSVWAELVEILGPMVYVCKEGDGKAIGRGQTGSFHYTGILAKDGKKFDSSRDKGTPFTTPLKTAFENPSQPGGVIEGWVLGLVGMKVGERRWILVPSNLGYGPTGSQGGIGPNADLIFEAELIKIEPR